MCFYHSKIKEKKASYSESWVPGLVTCSTPGENALKASFSWIPSGNVKGRGIPAKEPRNPGTPRMVQKQQTSAFGIDDKQRKCKTCSPSRRRHGGRLNSSKAGPSLL